MSVSEDWLITRYGNGLQKAVYSTWRHSNDLVMTGSTNSYSGTLNMPSAFVDSLYSATASISYNGAVVIY